MLVKMRGNGMKQLSENLGLVNAHPSLGLALVSVMVSRFRLGPSVSSRSLGLVSVWKNRDDNIDFPIKNNDATQ